MFSLSGKLLPYVLLAVLVATSGVALLAQSVLPPQVPLQLNYAAQTKAMAIPTTLSSVINQDAWICGADFSGTTQSLLVEDQQPTPIPWLNGTFLTSNGGTFFFITTSDQGCRFMRGGIQWQAGTSGVTGHLLIKCYAAPCTLVAGNY